MNRETDPETLRRTLWQLVAVMSILGVLLYSVLDYVVASDIADPESTLRVGSDYSTFHAAAQIVCFGEPNSLYDVAEIAAVRST